MIKLYDYIFEYILKKMGRHYVLDKLIKHYENDQELNGHNDIMRLNIFLTESFLTSKVLYDINDYNKIDEVREILNTSVYMAVKKISSID